MISNISTKIAAAFTGAGYGASTILMFAHKADSVPQWVQTLLPHADASLMGHTVGVLAGHVAGARLGAKLSNTVFAVGSLLKSDSLQHNAVRVGEIGAAVWAGASTAVAMRVAPEMGQMIWNYGGQTALASAVATNALNASMNQNSDILSSALKVQRDDPLPQRTVANGLILTNSMMAGAAVPVAVGWGSSLVAAASTSVTSVASGLGFAAMGALSAIGAGAVAAGGLFIGALTAAIATPIAYVGGLVAGEAAFAAPFALGALTAVAAGAPVVAAAGVAAVAWSAMQGLNLYGASKRRSENLQAIQAEEMDSTHEKTPKVTDLVGIEFGSNNTSPVRGLNDMIAKAKGKEEAANNSLDRVTLSSLPKLQPR